MPAFDHGSVMSVAEPLPTNTKRQHCLDLGEIGSLNNIMVIKHLARLIRMIIIVILAFTRRNSEKTPSGSVVPPPHLSMGVNPSAYNRGRHETNCAMSCDVGLRVFICPRLELCGG